MKEEQREIERNKNKNIWAAIQPNTRQKPIIIGRDGNRIEDTRELAEAFKDSFKENSTPMTEGQKDIQELVNKAICSTGFVRTWKFGLVSELEMLRAIKAIKPNKTAGPDGIHGQFLRSVAEQITPNLT